MYTIGASWLARQRESIDEIIRRFPLVNRHHAVCGEKHTHFSSHYYEFLSV
jgi:hypothetical protein